MDPVPPLFTPFAMALRTDAPTGALRVTARRSRPVGALPG